MKSWALPGKGRQKGAALLIFAVFLVSAVLAVFLKHLNRQGSGFADEARDGEVLLQAKEALIGFAATYRDTHPDQVFAYLPCPDTDNDGVAEAHCGLADVPALGLLPWKTLGLPPLMDNTGECLWYAVSGRAKNNPTTETLNWDTPGQFIVQDSNGQALVGATAHERPLAVVFAPRTPLSGQSRSASSGEACKVSKTPVADRAAYLEMLDEHWGDPAFTGDITLRLADAGSLRNGSNNDRARWIASRDIFDQIRKRDDFGRDINELIGQLAFHLSANPPAASPDNKGMGRKGEAIDGYGNVSPRKDLISSTRLKKVRDHWRDNLLYAKGDFLVDNNPNPCQAILIFSGERTAGQSRVTPDEKNTPGMYLEPPNTAFPATDFSYRGADSYDKKSSSADVVRCITRPAAQVSFAADLQNFVIRGTPSTVTTNTDEKTVTITSSASTTGGCFWSPIPVPLVNRNLRAYYEYQFGFGETYPESGEYADKGRGNGFVFQLVRGDTPQIVDGLPDAPNICGLTKNMGALAGGDSWGNISYIVETDVRQNADNNDPPGNHTAIMINGDLTHETPPSPACDGSDTGCRHDPANRFEELPTPLLHNQRIEIHTGCNTNCSVCNPESNGGYALISTWVDCQGCSDVTADYLDPELITRAENRLFNGNGDWSGTSWSVSGNTLAHHTTGTGQAVLPNTALAFPPVLNRHYHLELRVNTRNAGTLSVRFGGTTVSLGNQSANASAGYRLQIKAINSGKLTLIPDADWTGNLSQISLRAVRSPSANRCVVRSEKMAQTFFGLGGGFLSGQNTIQSVTIQNLFLRAD